MTYTDVGICVFGCAVISCGLKGEQLIANYPTQKDITLWTSSVVDIFQSIIPPIDKPYPRVYIATEKTTFPNMRSELIEQTRCVHTHIEESEAAIMEYIHGDKGNAILIRQNLIFDKNEDYFCGIFWHELGHFYAINCISIFRKILIR